MHTKFLSENLKGRDHSEDLDRILFGRPNRGEWEGWGM